MSLYATLAGEPPALYTLAFLDWCDRLTAALLARCPITRTTRKYIAYNAAGTSAGGGGAGTTGSPWLCATPAHINTLIANNAGSGDIRFSLRRGDTFYATNGGTGISINVANVTLDDWADGSAGHTSADAVPVISGFKAAYSGGWTQHATQTNLYYRTETDTVRWVREDDEPEHAMRQMTTASSLATLNGSSLAGTFVHDTANVYGLGANTLVIHPKRSGGSAPTSTTQSCVGSGDGIEINGNGSRLNNLRSDGWGMTAIGSQDYCINATPTGTNAVAITNSTGFYSSGHVMGHYSTSGGVSLWINNRMGLPMYNGAGSSSVFNFYADSGGAEVVAQGNQIVAGGLKNATYNDRCHGQGVYAHTNTSVNALILVKDTTYPSALSAFGLIEASGGGQTATMSSRDDISSIRTYFINDFAPFIGTVSPGLNMVPLLSDCARINCTYFAFVNTAFGGEAFVGSATLNGIAINTKFYFDFATQAPLPVEAQCAIYNTAGATGAHFLNSAIYLRGAPGMDVGLSIWSNSPRAFTNSVFVNCILAAEGTAGGNGNTIHGAANATPTTSTGGYSGCVFSGFRAADAGAVVGYDGSQRPITLGNLGEAFGAPQLSNDAALLLATGVHPRGWNLEYDARGFARIPGKTTVGPIELVSASMNSSWSYTGRSWFSRMRNRWFRR